MKSGLGTWVAALGTVVLVMSIGASDTAIAADATTVADSSSVTSGEKVKKGQELEEIVVTGSLIPQLRAQTATPVTVITAEDIQIKGFSSVADALQHTSFATGSVQGAQYTGGFTQGAKTLSLFGLSPSYTKYLIDGRPIADYPALYNGTDIITSISGIPEVMVDHIDILPGGQSSIYGSDAIAGVVNISLKKTMDGPVADVRYGWTKDGGGTSRRIGLADGFTFGGVNVVVGAQYERIDPIWGFQRDLTKQYFGSPASPQVAERDWLVVGLNGQPNGDLYYFLDPANCANVANQYGGSVTKTVRPGRGTFCGTTKAGYYTLDNGDESTQGFLHASDDINSNVQLFTDILLNHDVTKFNHGTPFLSTSNDSSSPYTYYSDPNIPGGDLLNLQQIYTPEEAGNLRGQDDKDTNNSIRATIGVQGALWSSDWKYTVDMTYTENKLTEATHLAFTNEINDFYAPIFGPNLGPDPIYGQPQYAVDYAAFYKPITPAQFASFTGYATSYSKTEDSLARAQLTNSSLFALPGGNAGIALLVEGGAQGWDYEPDPRFLDGETYLFTATAGSGHRSRYASTVELRLPVVNMVTIDASTRYDDYRVSGENVDKFTYNLGFEFRPISSLLIRGRYGTAFKAPTLSDEFQGTSGFFTDSSTDYYTCTKQGFATHLADCPYANTSFFGTTEGNRTLKPITAKVADGGIVWSPFEHSAFTADYLHWKISNEVQQQNSDQLLRTDSACLLGQLDVTSPTCVAAISQVTRDANGLILQIDTPKQNLSEETLNVLALGANYTLVTGGAGNFTLEASYSDILKHTFVQFAGDAQINLLDSPFYSTEFKTKENLSVTWDFHQFGTTFYVERYGQTANYAAALTVAGYYGPDAAPGAGRLGTWTIANWSAKYEVLPGLVVSANVINLFDKAPPVDNSYTGISNQPYNVLNYNDFGRSFFVQANYKLHK
ncbi:MAG: TonB-dependent receptor [Gammaproteobacteria bacterium]